MAQAAKRLAAALCMGDADRRKHRNLHRWALESALVDMDKPSVPDQSDVEEYQKVIGSYIESMTARYYALMPKVTNMANSKPTDKFAEIITFRVKFGKDSDFESAITRVNDAAQKTRWQVAYIWHGLAFGEIPVIMYWCCHTTHGPILKASPTPSRFATC